MSPDIVMLLSFLSVYNNVVSYMLVAPGQSAIVCLMMFWYCSGVEHSCSHQYSTSCNDTVNHQLKLLWYPSTPPQVRFDETPCSCQTWRKLHSSIHFLQYLIHSRNWQFSLWIASLAHLMLTQMHIILVWLRSYHSWVDPAWLLHGPETFFLKSRLRSLSIFLWTLSFKG